MKEPCASFVLSLDTELAWGYHDLDALRARRFSADGSRERRSIAQLLDLLDEFRTPATWAVVGHMMYAECEHCEICPVLDWKGRYSSFEEVWETAHPLWYGRDVVEAICQRNLGHELAFHGYTHRVLDEQTSSPDQVRLEIREWQRLARRWGREGTSVVFPRNQIGHLDLFAEAGFRCFRGYEPGEPGRRRGVAAKLARTFDQLLGLSTPPVHSPRLDPSGMLELPASHYLFGFNRTADRILDTLGVGTARVRRVLRGIDRAVERRRLFHLWCHPWEFRTPADLLKLRRVLAHVAGHVAAGRLRVAVMRELAEEAHPAATDPRAASE